MRDLDRVAEALADGQMVGVPVTLEGHSDATGDSGYNLALSQRRAAGCCPRTRRTTTGSAAWRSSARSERPAASQGPGPRPDGRRAGRGRVMNGRGVPACAGRLRLALAAAVLLASAGAVASQPPRATLRPKPSGRASRMANAVME